MSPADGPRTRSRFTPEADVHDAVRDVEGENFSVPKLVADVAVVDEIVEDDVGQLKLASAASAKVSSGTIGRNTVAQRRLRVAWSLGFGEIDAEFRGESLVDRDPLQAGVDDAQPALTVSEVETRENAKRDP